MVVLMGPKCGSGLKRSQWARNWGFVPWAAETWKKLSGRGYDEASRKLLPCHQVFGLLYSSMVPLFPTAGQEPLHNEGQPVVAGRVAQPRPLEPEEQRAGGRPRRRRDLGSRLQAQRRAQQAWAEVDENEEEAVIPGKQGPSPEGKGTCLGGKRTPTAGWKSVV